ncbi:MAG: SLC13 family permease [Candidatus Bipolaricaulota bacterium]|nr:SLC13 family permease [Candidatus Bipolaricaulota bacterium]
MSGAALAAAGVFALTYALILSGKLSPTLGALLGAVAMVLAGVAFGFYSPHAVVEVIDVDTIWLLSGMMIIVGLLQRTGFFQYVAIKAAKWSRGNLVALFLALALASAVVSMFLDNVTTMLTFVPVTLSIAEVMGISSVPLLLGEAIAADLGGVFTLIGDPPNVIIGSAGRLTFNDFLTHTAPVALVALLAALAFLLLRYRKVLRASSVPAEILQELDERKVLTDPKAMTRLLLIFAGVILLFVVHAWLRLTPGLAALCGAALAIAVLRPSAETVLGSIDWELLVFLLSLFVVVGGLNRSGALPFLARQLGFLGQGSLIGLALLFFWGAGILSLFLSSVPATVAFVPLVQELRALGVPANPLWWALALGIGFAGPATPFATPANLAVVNLTKHGPEPLHPRAWVAVGLPVYLLIGILGSVLLWLAIRIGWFL